MKQNICKGITAVIALTMSITACTTQDEVIGEGSFASDPTAVRISASVGSGVFTRTAPESSTPADQQKFLAGDKIVLASTATGQSAVTYTLGTDGTTWTPETGKYLKWMNDKNPMNMEAFYPAPHTNGGSENNNASLTTFTLPSGQYGDADEDTYIGRADYMTYTGSVTPGDNGTASITMQRQTARVQVKITALGSEIGAGESFQVNVYSQYGGIPTTDDANKDTKQISSHNWDSMKQNSVCTALVIPGDGKPKAVFLSFIRLDSDGNYINDASGFPIVLNVTGIPAMEAGKSYLYNLTVGKDKAEISSVEVKDWTSGGVIEDNGETEEAYSVDAATHTIALHKAGVLNNGVITTAMNGGGNLKITGPLNNSDITTLATYSASALNVINLTGADLSAVTAGDFSSQSSLKYIIGNELQGAKLATFTIPSTAHMLYPGASYNSFATPQGDKTLNCYVFSVTDTSYKLFYLDVNGKNWGDADAYCTSLGGRLISYDNEGDYLCASDALQSIVSAIADANNFIYIWAEKLFEGSTDKHYCIVKYISWPFSKGGGLDDTETFPRTLVIFDCDMN